MNKGNIVVPLLVIVVIVFSYLLTSNNTLYNKTSTESDILQGEASVQTGIENDNLQIKSMSFSAPTYTAQEVVETSPRENNQVCHLNDGVPNKSTCYCAKVLIECRDRGCFKIYKSDLEPNPPEGSCNTSPHAAIYNQWCNDLLIAPEDGIYCL